MGDFRGIMNRKSCLLVILMFFSAFFVCAEKKNLTLEKFPDLSSSAEISMVTVYPGNEIYSLFGHSSFRVFDPLTGIDWMFNYGTFDFDDPLFIPKFVKGQLHYYLAIDRFQSSLRFYSEVEGRRVTEQMLNLDYEEKKTVYNFLLNNSLPENRYYQYDFVNDNCSTRIADVLIKCFGENIRFPEGNSTLSFRQMISSYLFNYPLLGAGIEIVLGSPADRIPSGVEKFFLPVPMIAGFDNAVLKSKAGIEKKLVSEKRILSRYRNINDTGSSSSGICKKLPSFKEFCPPDEQGNEFYLKFSGTEKSSLKNRINYIFFAALLFPVSEVFLLLMRDKKGKKAAEFISRFFEAVFLSFSGISGCLLFYLWFLSDHVVPNWNFHILWMSPFSLVYILFLVFGKHKRAAFLSLYTARILFISAALFILLFVAGIQTVSLTLLPLYAYSLCLFFRKGKILEAAALKRIFPFFK